MTFEEWLETVPQELKGDSLWRMEVYRLAVLCSDLAWRDVCVLVRDRRTLSLADQLYRAVGSVSANIAEGYGRGSPRDQTRFYEYALGSARESRGWYYAARHMLSEQVVAHRLQLLTSIIRLLLTIIPSERGHKISEERPLYGVSMAASLDNLPVPEDEHATCDTQHAPRSSCGEPEVTTR